MKLCINMYGSIAQEEKKYLDFCVGSTVSFESFAGLIEIKIEEIVDDYFSISTNRDFCVELNNEINMSLFQKKFVIPTNEEIILAMPLYDCSLKFKIKLIEEA